MTRTVTPQRRIDDAATYGLSRIVAPFGSAAWAMHQLVTRTQPDAVTVGLLLVVAVALFAGVHYSIVLTDDRLNRGEAASGGESES
jgi:hypothetical protein